MLAFDHFKATDTATDVDTDFFGIIGSDFQAAHRQRIVRRRDRKMHEPPHLLDLFFVNEVGGVEVLHFTGNLTRVLGGVEKGNAFDAVLAGKDRLPDTIGIVTDRTDQPNTSDNDTTRHRDIWHGLSG